MPLCDAGVRVVSSHPMTAFMYASAAPLSASLPSHSGQVKSHLDGCPVLFPSCGTVSCRTPDWE
eukprot:462591-Amphidinium_carterae.1